MPDETVPTQTVIGALQEAMMRVGALRRARLADLDELRKLKRVIDDALAVLRQKEAR